MLALLIALVGFVVSFGLGIFSGSFSVTLADGSTLDNVSAVDAATSLVESCVDTLVNSDIVGYIAYFLPLSGFYLLTEIFFVCIVSYLVASQFYKLVVSWATSRSS